MLLKNEEVTDNMKMFLNDNKVGECNQQSLPPIRNDCPSGPSDRYGVNYERCPEMQLMYLFVLYPISYTMLL